MNGTYVSSTFLENSASSIKYFTEEETEGWRSEDVGSCNGLEAELGPWCSFFVFCSQAWCSIKYLLSARHYEE